MDKILKSSAVVLLLVLGACGDSDLERGASGAAIGAVTAEVLDENVLVGAAVGGAVGMLADDF